MRQLKIYFVFSFLLCCVQSFGQSGSSIPKDSINFEVDVDPDFFLLGTFSDYAGGFEYIDRDKKIDKYYPYEASLTHFLFKYIFDHYQIKVDTVFKESRHSEIFSQTLAQRLHKYYDENGNLKGDLFDSEEKEYSFITGTFYRYGALLEGNIYKIHLYNSPKDREIYALLKALACDKIVYKFLRENIPASDIFYFEAPPKLIQYFNTVKSGNKAIQDAKQEQILTIFKGKPGAEEEYKKKFTAAQNKLLESLKHIFE